MINRSKVEDSGEYDCVAINEEGVVMATISIEIESRPGTMATSDIRMS